MAFDMRGAELSHRGGDCSFETVLEYYDLRDPGLRELAKIVHEADLRDERFDAPEAPGLDAVLRGLALRHDDEELLAVSAPLFDALYAWCCRRLDAVPNQPYS